MNERGEHNFDFPLPPKLIEPHDDDRDLNQNDINLEINRDVSFTNHIFCLLLKNVYIEDYPFSCLLTPLHNCDVRNHSDQSNHTILEISRRSCDLIGHCFSDVTAVMWSEKAGERIIFDILI